MTPREAMQGTRRDDALLRPDAGTPPDVAIAVQHVTKRFKLYDNPVTGPIKEWLCFWRTRRCFAEHLAVDGVSFIVRKGEIVGIIGPNGAGKTTLLKMIAGLLPVNEGRITVTGKVNALLALGVGVHPEFTGRENIAFGAMLLGMPRKDVLRKTAAIIEFAELGEFIDRPFRTYSAGMRARLLFSISMSVDPDVLIIDEALATGDAHFVKKCLRRIREVCRKGATVLFVSHNLSHVQELCDRALFIADGKVQAIGKPEEAIATYNEWQFQKESGSAAIRVGSDLRPISGDGRIRLEAVRLRDEQGHEVTGVYTGGGLRVEMDYTSELPAGTDLAVFLGIMRQADKQWVAEVSSKFFLDTDGSAMRRIPVRSYRRGTITVDMSRVLLLNNHYTFWIMFYAGEEVCAEYTGIAPFFVARRTYVFDRAPVYTQPAEIVSTERPPR